MTIPSTGEKWSPHTFTGQDRFLALITLNEAFEKYFPPTLDPESALRDLRLDDEAFFALFLKLPPSFQQLWPALTPERRDLWLRMLQYPIPPRRRAAHRTAIAEATEGYGSYVRDTLAIYAAIALVEIMPKLQGLWQ